MSAPDPLHPLELDQLRAERPDVRVIDVRTPGEFAHRHIPGSYNVPLPDLAEHRAELRAATGPVVLVCESGRRASTAETQLRDAGFGEVHVLDGGVAGWAAAGQPVSRISDTKAPWALERQVRLVAGGIVASAVAASLIWPPARFLAGAVGAGLVFAAVTDTCAMGLLLGRLPYNRRGAASCDLPTVVAPLTHPQSPAPSEVRS
jgi:rhodanese-related sulfurtransferase